MIKVTKIKCLGGYRLRATFSDGAAGEHDFSALVAETGPMGQPFRDPAYFARVFLEDGALTWPNGFDMQSGCAARLKPQVACAGEGGLMASLAH
jgi:hypothetical protein